MKTKERLLIGLIKWHDKEVISEEEMNWIIPAKVRPGNVHANPKAHKEGLPYRYIISAR